MAIPPEPIDEVLPEASAAVLAEVSRVVKQDPQEPLSAMPEGATDMPGVAARQVVELKVRQVLFGSLGAAGASLEVVKPAGDYALRAGNQGPFLLKQGPKGIEIVGRYGPDTYSESLIRTAARRLGKQ